MATLVENIKILVDAMESNASLALHLKCKQIEDHPAYKELEKQLSDLAAKRSNPIFDVQKLRTMRAAQGVFFPDFEYANIEPNIDALLSQFYLAQYGDVLREKTELVSDPISRFIYSLDQQVKRNASTDSALSSSYDTQLKEIQAYLKMAALKRREKLVLKDELQDKNTLEDIIEVLNNNLKYLRIRYSVPSQQASSSSINIQPEALQLIKEFIHIAQDRLVVLFGQELKKLEKEEDVPILCNKYQMYIEHSIQAEKPVPADQNTGFLTKINKLAGNKIRELRKESSQLTSRSEVDTEQNQEGSLNPSQFTKKFF